MFYKIGYFFIQSYMIFILFIILLNGCSKSSNFYVEKATFLELDKQKKYYDNLMDKKQIALDDRMFVVKGHRITEGTGTILAYRLFYRPLRLATDQGTFEKVTILLPSDMFGNKGKIRIGRDSEIIVFFSKGASSFPGKSGCFGYAKEGYLELNKESSGDIDAKIYFKVEMMNLTRFDDCRPIEFKKDIRLKKKLVSELSPWDGAIGSIIVEETHF